MRNKFLEMIFKYRHMLVAFVLGYLLTRMFIDIWLLIPIIFLLLYIVANIYKNVEEGF